MQRSDTNHILYKEDSTYQPILYTEDSRRIYIYQQESSISHVRCVI